MSKPDARSAAKLHDDLLIGTTLSHMHAVEEAQKLSKLAAKENPVVAFGTQDGGQIHYSAQITPSSMQNIRIRVSAENAPAEYRYFKRLASKDGTKVKAHQGEHGLSASAWVETDANGDIQAQENGLNDIRICYPGYTGDSGLDTTGKENPTRIKKFMNAADGLSNLITDSGVAAHTASMDASLHGEFPQAREVGPFLDKVMEAAKAADIKVGKVVNNSWSMGAANALASNLYFKHREIPSEAILGDAWRASAAVNNISQRSSILLPLFNNSETEAKNYSQPKLREMLAQNVTSVYPAVQNKKGNWRPKSGTAPGRFPIADWLRITPHGSPVGDTVFIDTKDMDVIQKLPGLGPTHQRTNIIHHLATHGDDALHEKPSMPAARRPQNSTREPTDLVTVSASGQVLEFTYPPQKPVKEYSQLPVKVNLDKLLADFPVEGRTGATKAPPPRMELCAACQHQQAS